MVYIFQNYFPPTWGGGGKKIGLPKESYFFILLPKNGFIFPFKREKQLIKMLRSKQVNLASGQKIFFQVKML